MPGWSEDQLRRIDGAEEVQIAPVGRDGKVGAGQTIWVVRVGEGLYVRSARVPSSDWHRRARATGRARLTVGGTAAFVAVQDADGAALDAVDAAYDEKYGRRYASIVEGISDEAHRVTTLRLIPRDEA